MVQHLEGACEELLLPVREGAEMFQKRGDWWFHLWCAKARRCAVSIEATVIPKVCRLGRDGVLGNGI